MVSSAPSYFHEVSLPDVHWVFSNKGSRCSSLSVFIVLSTTPRSVYFVAGADTPSQHHAPLSMGILSTWALVNIREFLLIISHIRYEAKFDRVLRSLSRTV